MFCSLFPKYCFMEWNHRHSSPTISIHLIISGNSLSLFLRLFVFVFHCNILKTKNTKTRKKKRKKKRPNLRHYCLNKAPNSFGVFRQSERPTSANPATLSLSLSVLRFLCSFLNPCFLDLSLASWIPEKKKFFSLPPSPPQFIAKHTVSLSLSLSLIYYIFWIFINTSFTHFLLNFLTKKYLFFAVFVFLIQ